MLARLTLVCCLLFSASSAAADAKVVVLGLRSVEGDDEIANNLTEQLRGAAKSVPGWLVSSAAVSMTQMTLAHGCDEIDAACLRDIAQGLQVDLVIYGTVRRNSARDDYDYALNLNLFDAQSGQIAREADDTLPRADTAFEAVAARAEKLIKRLSSTTTGGAIEVQANVPDAAVRVNGQDVGTTRDGALRLEGLQAGQYRVEVTKPGYAPHVTTVTVSDGADTGISAILSKGGTDSAVAAAESDEANEGADTGHAYGWLGWTLIGVGGASLIGTAVSMKIIDDVNSDYLYKDYRGRVYLGNRKAEVHDPPEMIEKDTCAAATEKGFAYELSDANFQEVVDMCNRADTFEVLQWVFLGTAVVAGGVGTYLVLTADDPSKEDRAGARTPRLSLRPSFGPRASSLTATLRF